MEKNVPQREMDRRRTGNSKHVFPANYSNHLEIDETNGSI